MDLHNLINTGLSLIPITDGAKTPHWSCLDENKKHNLLYVQSKQEELDHWLKAGAQSWALANGAVSKNLVTLDFDEKHYEDLYDLWYQKMSDDQKKIISTCFISKTRNKGTHVRYFTNTPQPTCKLARRAIKENIETTAEVRGNKSYALIPPSTGYELIQGDLLNIPIVTDELHEEFINILRTFNEVEDEPETIYENAQSATPQDRPGDRFNSLATWQEILTPAGWVEDYKDHWRRPGKKEGEGISATTNYEGRPMFYVFSTVAAPFKENRGYSKFHTYAIINHGGSFHDAAQALINKEKSMDGHGEATQKPQENTYSPVPWEEFNKIDFPIQRWRIKNLIPMEGFVILAAISGEGKTWIAMDMANAITSGRNFLGCSEFETIKGRALYIDGEMSKSEFQRRGRQLNLCGDFYYLSTDNLNLNDDGGVQWLMKYVQENSIDVIIVDTFRAVAGGLKEEKAEEIRQFFNRFKALKSKGVALVFLEHFRKPQRFEGKTPQKENLFGSQDKVASVEGLIMMRKKEDSDDIDVYQRKNRLGKEIPAFTITIKDENFNDKIKTTLTYGGELKEEERIIEQIKTMILDLLQDGGRDTSEILAITKDQLKAGDRNARAALRALVIEGAIDQAKRGRQNYYMIPVTNTVDGELTASSQGDFGDF